MMADMDRSKRYDNSPKAKHGKMQNKQEAKAEGEVKSAEAKEGAGKGPTDSKPGGANGIGKIGEDPGPEPGKDEYMGVMQKQHADEISAAMKTHHEAISAEVERHGKHMKEMHARHAKARDGMQDKMEIAGEKKAEATAGSPKELGKEKDEGKKGAEV
jgi:hypothetical protein